MNRLERQTDTLKRALLYQLSYAHTRLSSYRLADVVEVAQADAHVVLQMVGDGDGDGDSDQSVTQPQRQHGAVTPEQFAQQPPSHESDRCQHRIRQMSHTEQKCGREAGQPAAARQLLDAREEERLLNVLLNDCPTKVADGVAHRIARAEQSVHGSQADRSGHHASGERTSYNNQK